MSVSFDVYRGRVIKELGLKRTDLVISTKLYFWWKGQNPNGTGLSRKQCVFVFILPKSDFYLICHDLLSTYSLPPR